MVRSMEYVITVLGCVLIGGLVLYLTLRFWGKD